MRIAIGADHAGFELKNHLAERLREAGHRVEDLGTYSADSVDYPDYSGAVARAVGGGDADRGLLVCGTGVGVAIAANKVDGVRAASCNDLFTAGMARRHNDANVLTLGARVVGPGVAEEITRIFFETDFEGGRHSRRVAKIHDLEG
ncbi:MAG: ribose 5-phosphate isomerase B [Holophagales bacterium]|nr:ribose 5-phosphate isomerase B [Holophagales bacterium]